MSSEPRKKPNSSALPLWPAAIVLAAAVFVVLRLQSGSGVVEEGLVVAAAPASAAASASKTATEAKVDARVPEIVAASAPASQPDPAPIAPPEVEHFAANIAQLREFAAVVPAKGLVQRVEQHLQTQVARKPQMLGQGSVHQRLSWLPPPTSLSATVPSEYQGTWEGYFSGEVGGQLLLMVDTTGYFRGVAFLENPSEMLAFTGFITSNGQLTSDILATHPRLGLFELGGKLSKKREGTGYWAPGTNRSNGIWYVQRR